MGNAQPPWTDYGQPSSPPWADFSNQPAQTVPQGYETVGGFADELPAHAHPLPPDVEKQIVHILATDPVDTAAEHARSILKPLGIYPAAAQDSKFRDSFDGVIAARKVTGKVSDSVINNLMTPEQAAKMEGIGLNAGAAGVRGAGGVIAPFNTLDSILHVGKDIFTGDTKGGVVADFNRWSDVNSSILHADELNHPDARLVGQVIGGLAIPSGMEGEALNAGKSVLRSGGTMQEARAAAASAAASRVAKEGAVIGASHGFDTADSGQGIVGAAEGAVGGAAGGYVLTKAGQIVAPIVSKTLGAIGEKFASDAPDYVQLARDLNIRRTPATASNTGIATVTQAGLDALPGGGPVSAAAGREVGDLATSARNVAEGVGTVSNPQGAGEAVAQGAQQYKQSSRGVASGMYQQRDNLMGGSDAPVVLNNFDKSLNELANQFPGSPAIQQLREHPVIRQVADAMSTMPGREATLGEATEALSHIRGVVRNLEAKNDATPVVVARVRKVEQALENDVMDAAKAADIANGRVPGSQGSAVKAQQDADAFYADRATALNGSLKKPIQSAKDDTKVSGESVYRQILGDMNAQGGNLARLRDTWFRLPKEAKSTFAATAIDDLGRALPGQQNDVNTAWSFQSFLTNLSKMSPQARNIVFGTDANQQIQKIAAYASRLRTLDRARNFSNTAKKYFAGAFAAAILPHIWHGDIAGALETTAAIPATWGGAKLLMASPAMRDWTAQAMKAVLSGNETALKVLTKKLGSIASTEPAIASDALGLQRAIARAVNDNSRIGTGVAASPEDGNDNRVMGYQTVANPDRSAWDHRADGSEKGTGFLGLLRRPDGGVSSEISVGVGLGGKETEIPLMVPGLTKPELDYLMTHDPGSANFQRDMPKTILPKAVAHAKARVAAGLSPFK